MTLAISIENLTHTYIDANKTNTILNNIGIDLHANQVIALLGQSGCGKSTLLNLISGLEPIQSGEIKVFGESLRQLNDNKRTLLRRKKVGFIYQAFNLIPTLTVAENITLPLALNRIPQNLRSNAVEDMLDKMHLLDKFDQFPDRLSGGEQQRVAIARAIIHSPDLILADEPTGNLDAVTGRLIMDTLLSLTEQKACTLLLVTHSQEVAGHADLILTLSDGKLTQRGPISAW